jgi:hypothetical protein
MGKLESPFVVHVLVWIGHDGLEVLGAALASAFPALPRPKLLPAPALALTIAERPLGAKRSRSMSHSFVKWDYFSETAVGWLAGRPTANHAASRHLPCCFTHTVMRRLFTSAIFPLLFALKWIRPSTIALVP